MLTTDPLFGLLLDCLSVLDQDKLFGKTQGPMANCVREFASHRTYCDLMERNLDILEPIITVFNGWGTTQRREWILHELHNRFSTIFATDSCHILALFDTRSLHM